MGESFAGLFVVETMVLEPALFDSYVAVDPSLWWNKGALTKQAEARLRERPEIKASLFLAGSGPEGNGDAVKAFADMLAKAAPKSLTWHHEAMPDETHMTIFHPAALKAFRRVFRPKAG